MLNIRIFFLFGGGGGVEYAHRFPACRMRRLKGCPDGSTSMTWDIPASWTDRDVGLVLGEKPPEKPRPPVTDGPNRCQYSQTSRTESPLNTFYTWYNVVLTGLHRSPVVSIPFYSPQTLPCSRFTSLLPSLLSLTCTTVQLYVIHLYHVCIITSIFSRGKILCKKIMSDDTESTTW